jgi:hypothetical protein
MGESFKDELGKFMGNLFATFIVFLLIIFITGMAYAYYFIELGSALMLWLPVALLVVILFYKVLE